MDILRLIPSRFRTKKQLIITITALVLILISTVCLICFSRQARDLNDVLKDQTLRVVTEYSSIGYFVEENEIKGFQYELITRFADSLGLKVEFTLEPDLQKSIDGVNDGSYDLIMRAIPVTLELKKKLIFSEPLIKSKLVLVRRSDVQDGYI